jgi:sphingolipid delta-4 desaturase
MTTMTTTVTMTKPTVNATRSSSRLSATNLMNEKVMTRTRGEFTWSETDEPHATRRHQILAAHPEIAELFTTEPLTFWLTLGIVCFQVSMAWSMRNVEWYTLLACTYIISGTLNHSLQLAIHELSHDLCWSGRYKDAANRLTAIMGNLATCIPSAQTFKPYHMDHHQYQGVDGIDTDIPHAIEVNYVTNTITKILWILAQPLCYALRPMLIKPKPFRLWEAINWICCFTFNFSIWYFMGTQSLTYLIGGTLLGLGLHPSAGHFIAEHYEFVSGVETYSYYGPMNFFNFNVGYHNEHHDFPRIPWSKLPLVRKIAPEFYDHLPCYHSYVTEVFWPYITNPELGVWSRVKRKTSAKVYECLAKTTDKRKFQPFRILCIGGLTSCAVWLVYTLVATVVSSRVQISVAA